MYIGIKYQKLKSKMTDINSKRALESENQAFHASVLQQQDAGAARLCLKQLKKNRKTFCILLCDFTICILIFDITFITTYIAKDDLSL
jgi:hypothetical protein